MSRRTTAMSSSVPKAEDAGGGVARRPHEGAGPCVPFGGRRPGRTLRRARAALLASSLVLAAMGAASLAACGAASTGAASSPAEAAATPAPGSAPLAGTPEAAVAAYWEMVDADDYAGIAAASAPGVAAVTPATDDIGSVELLRVTRVQRTPGGAQVEVDVRIVPATEATPWGEAGRHTLFVNLAKADDGAWLVAGWGSSP